MKLQLNYKISGLTTLLILLVISSPVFAQADDPVNEETQQYEELVKFRTNYTIEQQEESSDKFDETLRGIGTETPGDVFLADLTVTVDPNKLREAALNESDVEEQLAVGDYGAAEYQDLFSEEGEGSSGFTFGSSSGHCPPGAGINF